MLRLITDAIAIIGLTFTCWYVLPLIALGMGAY